MNIEELAKLFQTIPEATANNWHVHEVVERLYLSRSESGRYALFLEGEQENFSQLPKVPGLQHSATITALPGGKNIEALRVSSPDGENGNRILAHIGYELGRRLEVDPTISNAELLKQTAWVFNLLGGRTARFLAAEQQRGLAGECTLLRQLLLRSQDLQLSCGTVLQRWWGYAAAKRDFAAKGIAIEVKTTGANARIHDITSISQLDPQTPEEAVFLYSVGIKQDASAVKKLPAFVNDVEVLLIDNVGNVDADALDQFHTQLLGYGYDHNEREYYEAQSGFMPVHLDGAFFPESTLERVRMTSFVDGTLPGMVTSVAYTLNVTCSPVWPEEAVSILDALLLAPPLSN